MISDQLAQDIGGDALVLKDQYSRNALIGLLDAEQIRIAKEEKITLGISAKDLAKGAINFVGDGLQKNRIVTNALLMTYVVNQVVDYLIAEGVINQANINRERFVIALVVALIMDAVYKKWEEYRKK